MRWSWDKNEQAEAPLKYVFAVNAELVEEAVKEALTTILVRERDVWDAMGTEVRKVVREELQKSEHQNRIRNEVKLLFERFPAIIHDDGMLKNVVQAIMGYFQTTR